ncbi:MAG: OsmC family protein [Cyclobacteriaceae bacterium]
MPTIKTNYQGQLRTQSKHLQSGNTLITDAPTDNNGKGEAFSPTDMVAAALSSCMMTIMGIIAERENIDMTGLKSDVTKMMASDPRRIAEIKIDFSWPEAPITEAQGTKLKRAALTCPVALSLHPDLKQTIRFDF